MINKELEQLNRSLRSEILEKVDSINKEKAEMLETITKQINRENELIEDLFFLADWILSNASDRIRVYKKQYLEIVDKYNFEQYMPSKNTLILLRKKLLKEAEK